MADTNVVQWPPDTGPRGNVREAVAVFSTSDDLQAAVDELETRGFDRAALSRLAPVAVVERTLGHRLASVAQAEDDPAVPRTALIEPESVGNAEGVLMGLPVYVGAIAGAAIAAANTASLLWIVLGAAACGGLGGWVGWRLYRRFSRRRDRRTRAELERGGLLLWVRTGGADQETIAQDILSRYGARDVHMHGPTPAT